MLPSTTRSLKFCGALGSCAAIVICTVYITKSAAQSPKESRPQAVNVVDSSDAAPIYGVTIPPGYRDWKLISVNRLSGKLNQLRAQLGNDMAIKAFKDGTRPFPDGAIIAAVHWNYEPSEKNDKVLASLGVESFVAGPTVNVQFMVKDSKKYAASGGWGFADFKAGKPGDRALHETCFPCHQPATDSDYLFVHYAPQ